MAAGFIAFRLIEEGEEGEEIINLGGAGWETWEEVQSKWDGIVDKKDDSIYVADLEDENSSILDTKIVHADVIEERLGNCRRVIKFHTKQPSILVRTVLD